MKSILYIVAIIAILAGGWFSYQSKDDFQQLRDKRTTLDGENENRKASIKTTKEEAKEREDERDAALSDKIKAESELDNVKSNLKLARRRVNEEKNKIAAQDEELGRVKDLIEQIKKQFKDLGDNVELEQVPALVKQLEDELKKANRDLEELELLNEKMDGMVNANTKTIQELDTRISKRAARIKGNSAEGRVTAVNHDWGFVTLEIPSNMPVTAEAKLMIKRGMSYIGNLNVNAIEGRRIVADIDYRSMTPGMVVQPGDHVILAKPVTN
ncbi:hypothetical protein HW115_12495 [Verrucomicrobiaceae bacterium N1E253]|uniref:Uncharacterized protein n=1 Tax=Oceaniferula marina TaxID=2748318 RepID=A0A851GFZ0_9BACT|nr:hypothetical protein [Oceaniferula marina]NWK56433.1 hypothetical protein [Oceaniferula marina]